LRAELKRLHSPDVPDLSRWIPENDEFAILLQIIVGPAAALGEESFDVTLCSLAWLQRQVESERIVTGYHLLIVSNYDYDVICGYVSRYVASRSGETWRDVVGKLAQLGSWEFEDYRDYQERQDPG
jgi:hypothetical protein